jgi:predicted regulator of Ras-like GTPase activity (Roadblock/LC7/MglB family)
MENVEPLENMIDRIKKLSSVSDVVLMTKTGMFVLGSMRKNTSFEKFVGMAAILMGSAEAASMEMKQEIRGVVLKSKNTRIAITSVTDNILLAVTFMGKEHDREILQELEEIIVSK